MGRMIGRVISATFAAIACVACQPLDADEHDDSTQNASTVLTYQDHGATASFATTNALGHRQVDRSVDDFDGDGRADRIWVYDWSHIRYWQVHLSAGDRYINAGDWAYTSRPNVKAVGTSDVNGDGRADLTLQYTDGGITYWQSLTSTGSGFLYTHDWGSTADAGMQVVGMADFNNDLRADLLLQHKIGGTTYWQVRLSTGSDFSYSGDWASTTLPVESVKIADVNGDGRDDLIYTYNALTSGPERRWRVLLSSGGGFYQATASDWVRLATPYTVSPVTEWAMGDVNGDNRADLVVPLDDLGTRIWYVFLSSGSEAAFAGGWAWTNAPGVKMEGVADFNGDGLKDLLLSYDSGGSHWWQVRPSTGTSFASIGDWSSTAMGVHLYSVADVNGDDRADIVIQYDDSTMSHLQAGVSTGTAFSFHGDWARTPLPRNCEVSLPCAAPYNGVPVSCWSNTDCQVAPDGVHCQLDSGSYVSSMCSSSPVCGDGRCDSGEQCEQDCGSPCHANGLCDY